MENNIDKEQLIKYFIGKNNKKILSGGFSFCCFFLGWAYLFYRKYYKMSLILLVAAMTPYVLYCFVINYYLSLGIGLIVFVVQTFIAANFKKAYVQDASDFIDYTINNNNNISFDELKNICIKKGGTDVRVAIVYIIVAILAYAVDFISLRFLIGKQLTIHFPVELQEAMKNTNTSSYMKDGFNYYEASFTYEDDNNKCKFESNANDKYIITEEINEKAKIKEYMNDIYGINQNLDTKILNNIKLYTYHDSPTNTYYYLYIDNKEIQALTIEIIKDAGQCTYFKDYIENHIAYE